MEKEIKIDQYSRKEAKTKTRTITLDEIFNRIVNTNIDKPKNRRVGNVFGSRTKKGRRHDDIKEFTGLLFIDIDDCRDHVAVKRLFILIEHTIAVWFSSSGKNIHALINIPICKTVDEYKRRYKAFINLLEPYLIDKANIDKITSNPTQLAFESYDPEIYINKDAFEFIGICQTPSPHPILLAKLDRTSTTNTESWVLKKLTKNMWNIITNGYPQVMNNSIWLGGNISGGYIDELVARDKMEDLINGNPYLNSNSSSGSIKEYQKVARWGIGQGILKPIIWAD